MNNEIDMYGNEKSKSKGERGLVTLGLESKFQKSKQEMPKTISKILFFEFVIFLVI